MDKVIAASDLLDEGRSRLCQNKFCNYVCVHVGCWGGGEGGEGGMVDWGENGQVRSNYNILVS